MNAQSSTGRAAENRAIAEEGRRDEENVTSTGNSLVSSILLFALIFGLFVAGLYVLSLFTLWTMAGGIMMCIVALFLAFDLVPRLLT